MGICVCGLTAQVIMRGTGPDGEVHIHNTDMAIFEAGETRRDLPCAVSPNKAMLGFDLRYHASYEIAIPLRELSGSENLLTILFRVTDLERADEPEYFMQRVRVPSIEEGAKGDSYLHGGFDVGEGEYEVAWLMRDRAERVCSQFWDVKTELPNRDRQMHLDLGAGEMVEARMEQFHDEAPVLRARTKPLNVKVLVNFAPQNSRAATLQPFDTSALVSILRTISREPRIGKFSIVAFNLQEQRIIHRQDDVDRIDFPAIGESLDTLSLGTIDLQRLSEKHGETRFLTELMLQEFAAGAKPDALIFAEPKALLEKSVSQEELRELGEVDYPIFYMNYNLYPRRTPWRDAIGHAVKFLKGFEYTISRPRDLWYAVTEIVSRIVEVKKRRQVSQATME
ncbi:MAG: acetyltransferase [bacterium]|nr:acetyltransferase [bacterium]